VLIDGRNRLAACKRAGVESHFQSLNGHDAQAFIVSANLVRCNLSKGQQAMIYPEGNCPGRVRGDNALKLFTCTPYVETNRVADCAKAGKFASVSD